MPIDHERLTALFTEAMDLDAAGQRRLLARIDDAELRRELAEMLDADDHIVTALRTAGLKPPDFSGTFPYALEGLSLPQAVRAIMTTPPAHLDDPKLDAVCARALAKAPNDRFASAAELAAAVRTC